MHILRNLFAVAMVAGSVSLAMAQETVVKKETTVVKPDGSTTTTVVVAQPAAVESATVVKYDVPLLNVPSFGEDAKTVNMHFKGGEFNGLDAKAHIHKHKGSGTTVRMEFDDLKKVPATKRFVLWAYSPDGQYTRLGQVYNYKHRDEATIEAKTMLDDFGLFVTAEDTEVTVPTSTIYSVFTYVPQK